MSNVKCENGACTLEIDSGEYRGADHDQQEVQAARDAVKRPEIPFNEGFVDFGNNHNK